MAAVSALYHHVGRLAIGGLHSRVTTLSGQSSLGVRSLCHWWALRIAPSCYKTIRSFKCSSGVTNETAGLSILYPNVDHSLRALAGQAEGFGHFAIGGLHGAIYHVTTLSGQSNIHQT